MNRKLIAVATLALILSGCGAGDSAEETPTASAEPVTETATPPAAEPEAGPDESMNEEQAMSAEVTAGPSGEWRVEDILGGGVIDRSEASVVFPEPGRIAGSTGCNRYTGGYELEGDMLKLGPMAGTMMACPDELMAQERRFFEAMEQVVSWHVDPETDLLHLRNAEGETVIRASRMVAETEASM
ncbi:MAG: META domain-containing protein [Pseudomonadota bacterium]